MIDFDRSLKAKEVAEILGMSLTFVYDKCRTNPENGGIPSYKMGGSVIVKESDLKEWIEQQKRWR